MYHVLTGVALCLLATSCAPIEPHAFNGPNGKLAYSMKCNGMGRTIEDCYKKAGEICSKGYSIIDRSSQPVGVPVNHGTMIASNQTLAVECK